MKMSIDVNPVKGTVSADWIHQTAKEMIGEDSFLETSLKSVFDDIVKKICPECTLDLKEKIWENISSGPLESLKTSFRTACCAECLKLGSNADEERIKTHFEKNKQMLFSFVFIEEDSMKRNFADTTAIQLRALKLRVTSPKMFWKS
jgi:hypothetical protein